MPRETQRTVLVNVFLEVLSSVCFSQAPTKERAPEIPKINVRIVSLSPTNDDEVTFVLGVEGKSLPGADSQATVMFYPTDTASPVRDSKVMFSDKELLVKATAKVGTEIRRMDVLVEDKVVATTEEGMKVSIKANTDEKKVKQFEIKFEHQKNKEFPNLHSIVVTKEGGPDDAGFASNPHRMTVDLVPTGASDLNIVQSNAQQLDLHFVAALR